MIDLPERNHLILGPAVLVVIVGAYLLFKPERRAAGGIRDTHLAIPAESRSDGQDSSGEVHVAGAVRRPGVYRLKVRESRVDDMVRAAGGPTGNADLSALNLAAKVVDGQQIVVPAQAATSAAGSQPPPPGAKLSLNNATVDQLDELDGIGEVTAKKIVELRQQRGGFAAVEDLDQVSGIGEKRLEGLKESLGP